MRAWMLAMALLLGFTGLASAQDLPGAPDVARIGAGTYQVDPDHTQLSWTVDHMGLSPLTGMFGRMSGTLVLDPKAPDGAKVEITIPMAGLMVTSEPFAHHLAGKEFFDAAKFPAATFRSTRVTAEGTHAKIEGDLALHGVTRPVVLDAALYGAGIDVVTKLETVGFTATATLKRSDFGLGFAAPIVSDEVKLAVTGVFSKR